MRFIVDVNLTPDWIVYFRDVGLDALHWSSVGRIDASDQEIMQWAIANNRIILSKDLDFGTNLARSGDDGPSVVQLRTNTTLPARIGRIVVTALRQAEIDLKSGALLTIEEGASRIRALPFRKDNNSNQ